MDLPLRNDSDRAFAEEVRAFAAAELPEDIRRKGENGTELTREEQVRWLRILSAKGWIAPSWPVEAGGTGWDALQRLIFEIELSKAGAPRITNFGVMMCGPVLLHFGSDAQKEKYLPAIRATDVLWCQGYSEPGSGSDLASLKTRAVRQGDEYVVNGSKIWTSGAHWADHMFALVRTDDSGKKQEGITFLLIDMKAPGVTVRPIVRINGLHEFNQVFLDDVRVPVADRVGAEGEGWNIAKYLLGHERTSAAAGFGVCARFLTKLKEVGQSEIVNGRPLAEDRNYRNRVADLETQSTALMYTAVKALASARADRDIGAVSSIIKLNATRIQYDMAELLMESVGYYAQPWELNAMRNGWNEEPIGPDYAAMLTPQYLDWRKMRIAGGSDEVQKNVIAKHFLRL